MILGFAGKAATGKTTAAHHLAPLLDKECRIIPMAMVLRDEVEAFLRAVAKGWMDVIADPAAGIASLLERNPAADAALEQTQTVPAQREDEAEDCRERRQGASSFSSARRNEGSPTRRDTTCEPSSSSGPTSPSPSVSAPLSGVESTSGSLASVTSARFT